MLTNLEVLTIAAGKSSLGSVLFNTIPVQRADGNILDVLRAQNLYGAYASNGIYYYDPILLEAEKPVVREAGYRYCDFLRRLMKAAIYSRDKFNDYFFDRSDYPYYHSHFSMIMIKNINEDIIRRNMELYANIVNSADGSDEYVREIIRNAENRLMPLKEFIKDISANIASTDELSWSHLDNRFISQNMYIPGYSKRSDNQKLLVVITSDKLIEDNIIPNDLMIAYSIDFVEIIITEDKEKILHTHTRDETIRNCNKEDIENELITQSINGEREYDHLLFLINSNNWSYEDQRKILLEFSDKYLEYYEFSNISTWRNGTIWTKISQ